MPNQDPLSLQRRNLSVDVPLPEHIVWVAFVGHLGIPNRIVGSKSLLQTGCQLPIHLIRPVAPTLYEYDLFSHVRLLYSISVAHWICERPPTSHPIMFKGIGAFMTRLLLLGSLILLRNPWDLGSCA